MDSKDNRILELESQLKEKTDIIATLHKEISRLKQKMYDQNAINENHVNELVKQITPEGKEEPICIRFYRKIEDPIIREKAIKNYDPEFNKNRNAKSLEEAIWNGFNWGASPEGADFWFKYYHSL